MKRRCLVIAALVAGGISAAPAAASADPTQPCAITEGNYSYQAPIVRLLARINTDGQFGRAALGAQFAGLWFTTRDQGLGVGVAPGALDLSGARAAVLSQAAGRGATPVEVAELDGYLRVYALPYSDAELEALRDQLWPALQSLTPKPPLGIGVGCAGGDARRVVVTLWMKHQDPASIQAVQSLLAPHGDRVRLEIHDSEPPAPAVGPVGAVPGRPAPETRVSVPSALTYVVVASPKRCVRGGTVRVAIRAAARAKVRRLAVSVAGTRRTGSQEVRVPIASKATAVTITVTLRDGSRAVTQRTYRRCA